MAIMRTRRPRPSAEPGKVDFPATATPAEASEKMASFLDARAKRPGGRSTMLPVERATHDARVRAQSGDWSDAGVQVVVGLYAWCHRATYGEDPLELREDGPFTGASKLAGAMLREHFAGDVEAMVAFVKWTWLREQARRHAGKNLGRIGWRLQFSGSMLTDYRVDQRARSRR